MTAKDSLYSGFRWVLGDGMDINAVKDPWLKNKEGFCVDQGPAYGAHNISVSDFFMGDARSWDEPKVRDFFTEDDARLILATQIPNGSVKDRIAWTKSVDGKYTVKSGYQHWCDTNMSNTTVVQSSGWSKLWRLNVPHKVKTFLWRFCRNNVPVRNRLKSRGVDLPIICPMCDSDVEHLLHVFFDCPFASSCWQYVGVSLDMDEVEYAPDWLLQLLSTTGQDHLIQVARVL